jgi:formate C-acetyltransferase
MKGNGPVITAEELVGWGEWFAAGYAETKGQAMCRRWARAWRRWLEHATAEYTGGALAPIGGWLAGPGSRVMQPSAPFTWGWNPDALESLHQYGADAASLDDYRTLLEGAASKRVWVADPHTVGGNGFTHSIPNYGRVLREGLDAHKGRICHALDHAREAGETARIDFYESLLDLLEGIRAWHANLLARVASAPSSPDRDALTEALGRVPFRPARTFHEAVVAYNIIFYLDLCDNPGRIDRELQPFYARDLATGRITTDAARALLACFADNVCANHGWSAALGGSRPGGAPAYNEVTALCLEAAAGKFRPSYELAVRSDMPDELWETALDTLATGGGQPAFYNDALYMQSLRDADLGLTEDDICMWNGGGCTETMIHGCSNVGSLDAGINTAIVLDETLHDLLPTAPDFDTVIREFKRRLSTVIEQVTDQISAAQQTRAQWEPHPMRSLLIDDCIDRGEDYNARGARYCWSVVNVAGLTNCADALAALREIVFERREVTGPKLLTVLDDDFAGHEPLRQRLLNCPKFGNDESGVDRLAADLAGHVWSELRARRPWRGGHFLGACIMFTTYAAAGREVGALPDGRCAGEPLGDSIGAVTGRDRKGPTALFNSVLKLPLHLATGTPVLNMRLSPSVIQVREGRRALRRLVESYFRRGGMQLQLNLVDQDVLRDAIAHPELHGNLIVRVGGYSTYFNLLSDGLKNAVCARVEHSL